MVAQTTPDPQTEGALLPTCCYHCIIDGSITQWPKEAIPVLCARHEAMTVKCPTCNGTGGHNCDCVTCIGSGHIITDPILWAAELLALEYRAEAAKQGEHWLAYMILTTAEIRDWEYSHWIECHEGMVMMTQPGAPWENTPFAYRAEEAIITALVHKMREEARLDRE